MQGKTVDEIEETIVGSETMSRHYGAIVHGKTIVHDFSSMK